MENITEHQKKIAPLKKTLDAATAAYYDALQQWSLSNGTTPAIAVLESLEGKRTVAKQNLEEAVRLFGNNLSPKDALQQINGNIPILLMPIRIETRYVVVKHVIRNINIKDVIFIDPIPRISEQFKNTGFVKNADGTFSYSLPSHHRVFRNADGALNDFSFLPVPVSRKYIRKKNDIPELRIRFYPDEISIENRDDLLQMGEWESGELFWKNVCAGKEAQEEWIQLTLKSTAPRAAWIVKQTTPTNYTIGGALPATPAFPVRKLKDGAYTNAPAATTLPERFVVRLYKNDTFKEFIGNIIPQTVRTGIDPVEDPLNKQAGSGMQISGKSVQTPEYLQWIHDFGAAEKIGMAIRINLNDFPEYKTGVDKIIVTGVRCSADENDSAAILETLFENHKYQESGTQLIARGTPTNVVKKENSEQQRKEEEAVLFFKTDFSRKTALPANTDEAKLKSAISIHNNFALPNGSLMELNDATTFNRLLWPATWGYYLLQLFSPELDEPTRNLLREFFVTNVSGRGTLPVLKVNNQPYGVLPVSSLKDWSYAESTTTPEEKMLSRLWQRFLQALLPIYRAATSNIENLNATSQSTGIDEAFLKMIGTTAVTGKMERSWQIGLQFLSVLQFSKSPVDAGILIEDPLYRPAVVERSMLASNMRMDAFPQATRSYQTEVDQQIEFPLGKIKGIPGEKITALPGQKINYLEWLTTAKIIDVWNNNYPSDGTAPITYKPTLFEELCRQALLRTVLETGLVLAEKNEGLRLLKLKDFDALPLHKTALQFNAADSNGPNLFLQNLKPIINRYALTGTIKIEPDKKTLLQSTLDFTGGLSFADWIDKNKKNKASSPTKEAYDALSYFGKMPVSDLEKLFGEHFDLCSHRLDAWVTGLFQQRLNSFRKKKPTGIYLGGYGYLLNLKPSAKPAIIIKDTEPEYMLSSAANQKDAAIPLFHFPQAKANGVIQNKTWNRAFFYLGESSAADLTTDISSGIVEPVPGVNTNASDGYLHAPTLAHASAAAIMRSGYNNHKNDDKTSLLSIQLNAERVRTAMSLLEALQRGIPLGTQMGYYFERLLHENNADHILQDLRNIFPVHVRNDGNSGISPMTTIDGMDLLKQRATDPVNWLNAFPDLVSSKPIIERIALLLESYLDALNDLLLTESVYQTVRGNKARMAAPLRTLNNAGQPSSPEFIKNPQKGKAIVQRVGIILKASGTSWTKKGNIRSTMSPLINQWLGSQLPAPEKIVAVVQTGGQTFKLSMAEMDISPYDFLLFFPTQFSGNTASPLDLMIQLAVTKKNSLPIPAEATEFVIDYKDRTKLLKTEISIFECAGLVRSLKKLLESSKALLPEDFTLPVQKSSYPSIKPEKLIALLKAQTGAAGVFGRLIKTLDSNIKLVETAARTNKTGAALETPVKNLLTAIITSWQANLRDVVAPALFRIDPAAVTGLIDTGKKMKAALEFNLQKSIGIINSIAAGQTEIDVYDKVAQAYNALMGNTVLAVPEILPVNGVDLKTLVTNRSKIKNCGAEEMEQWITEASLVRKNMYAYRSALNFSEILSPEKITLTPMVLQLPFNNADQDWIGGKISDAMRETDFPQVSLVLEADASFAPQKAFSGILIDEWPEFIPEKMNDTGVSFQYDQPGTEPPQSLLLAVCPKTEGNWTWEFLTGAVEDALELAKIRLVRPEVIETLHPGLKHLLPAVMVPFAEKNSFTPVAQKL
ncbi:hypothetical protein [Pollutibacter soli]|uniref:hypothetical protein n=1 Tax=Pollutibacter soli TaxID=3034157 RepID=UPI0030136628